MITAGVAFGGLAARLTWIQVVKGAHYRYLSENNRIRIERQPAPRGTMFDRRGDVLADVRASFDAVAIPDDIPKAQRASVYAGLAQALSLTAEDVAASLEGSGPPRWRARVVKRQISREELAQVEAHRLELPGVMVQPNPIRNYTYGSLLGPVLGYVGEISSREIALDAYAEYESGDFLGRSGLEWAWEGKLRGEAGGEQVEVDVQGRKLRVLAERTPRSGNSLVLSIDRRLQEAAETAMGDQVGSVVALDVRTGDVLAVVSRPSYDPNDFARGVSAEEWATLSNDPRHPLQNRALQGTYPPGSTFKIVVALAGLAENIITPRTTVQCSGGFRFGGRTFRCWKSEGHGPVSLQTAIAQSCDVYFYQLGINLGVDTIQAYAAQLGLGAPTGIDLPGERYGLVPSKEWKRSARNKPWYPGETLSVAIGQGYVVATPLQLASMIATVANPDGARMLPRLVTRISDPRGALVEEIPPKEVGRLDVRRAQLDLIRDGLRQVVASPSGTGGRAEVKGYPVAGKTGTAQVVAQRRDDAPQESVPWERRDHALFVCYAPADDPKIAVSVVLDHGGHGGSAAAPVARAVVEAYRTLQEQDRFGAQPLARADEGPKP